MAGDREEASGDSRINFRMTARMFMRLMAGMVGMVLVAGPASATLKNTAERAKRARLQFWRTGVVWKGLLSTALHRRVPRVAGAAVAGWKSDL